MLYAFTLRFSLKSERLNTLLSSRSRQNRAGLTTPCWRSRMPTRNWVARTSFRKQSARSWPRLRLTDFLIRLTRSKTTCPAAVDQLSESDTPGQSSASVTQDTTPATAGPPAQATPDAAAEVASDTVPAQDASAAEVASAPDPLAAAQAAAQDAQAHAQAAELRQEGSTGSGAGYSSLPAKIFYVKY